MLKVTLGFVFSFTLTHAYGADSEPTRFTCDSQIGLVSVQGDRVSVDGVELEFEKEKLIDGTGFSSKTMGGVGFSACRLTSLLATKNSAGEIVVLRLLRNKPSNSAGVLCGMTKNPEKYGDPYQFKQLVISKDPSGKLKMKDVRMDRSEIKLSELKDPSLSEKNEKLKEELARPTAATTTNPDGSPYKPADLKNGYCRKAEEGGSDQRATSSRSAN